MKKIPYGRQQVSEEDIQAVVNVMRSDFLTQGPVVPAFESSVATYCQARHGVAVSNATAGLHLACLALGLGQGDLLWTSPITFVASANCALYCGAEVDFVDIDPRSFNMCPVELEKKLVIAKQNGRLPKIVIPVHMCGQACDMQAIYALSQKYGFKIIEDASHAIGARYKGEPVGNGKYSDMTVFSFHPVKIITTGEGGMVVTNNAVHAKNLMRLRSHGISSDPADMVEHPGDQIWNYQQLQLGFNYRMTELQAALGMSQLKQLDTFVNKRHSIAAMYDKLLGGLPLQTPWQHPDSYSSYHLYPIQIAASGSNVSQQKIYQAMHLAGIQANLHYIPVYLQPFYAAMGFKPGYCPHAENYYKQTISIPMFSSMTNEEQSHVIHTLNKALAGQSRRKKEKVIM